MYTLSRSAEGREKINVWNYIQSTHLRTTIVQVLLFLVTRLPRCPARLLDRHSYCPRHCAIDECVQRPHESCRRVRHTVLLLGMQPCRRTNLSHKTSPTRPDHKLAPKHHSYFTLKLCATYVALPDDRLLRFTRNLHSNILHTSSL